MRGFKVRGGLSSEIIKGNILFRDAPVVTHLGNGFVHKWRSTEIEFDLFRFRMFTQVLVNYRLVNKSEEAIAILIINVFLFFPVILFKRFRKNYEEFK